MQTTTLTGVVLMFAALGLGMSIAIESVAKVHESDSSIPYLWDGSGYALLKIVKSQSAMRKKCKIDIAFATPTCFNCPDPSERL